MSRRAFVAGRLYGEQGWSRVLGSSLIELTNQLEQEAARPHALEVRHQLLNDAAATRAAGQLYERGIWDDETASSYLDAGHRSLIRHQEVRRATHR